MIDESGGAFEFALGRTRRIAGQSPSANSAEQSSNRRRGRARCLETNSRFRDEEGDGAVGIVARPGQGSASLRLRDYKHSRQTRVGEGSVFKSGIAVRVRRHADVKLLCDKWIARRIRIWNCGITRGGEGIPGDAPATVWRQRREAVHFHLEQEIVGGGRFADRDVIDEQ